MAGSERTHFWLAVAALIVAVIGLAVARLVPYQPATAGVLAAEGVLWIAYAVSSANAKLRRDRFIRRRLAASRGRSRAFPL